MVSSRQGFDVFQTGGHALRAAARRRAPLPPGDDFRGARDAVVRSRRNDGPRGARRAVAAGAAPARSRRRGGERGRLLQGPTRRDRPRRRARPAAGGGGGRRARRNGPPADRRERGAERRSRSRAPARGAARRRRGDRRRRAADRAAALRRARPSRPARRAAAERAADVRPPETTSRRRSPASSAIWPPRPTTARAGRSSRRSTCASAATTTRSTPSASRCGSTAKTRGCAPGYGEALVAAAGGVVTADARAAFDKALAERAGPAHGALLSRPRRRAGRRQDEGDRDLPSAARRGAAGSALDGDAEGAARRADERRRAARRAGAARGAADDDPRHGRGPGGAPRRAAAAAPPNGPRLIRAYCVLQQPDKAKAALDSARKALAGDAEAGRDLDALARELGLGG